MHEVQRGYGPYSNRLHELVVLPLVKTLKAFVEQLTGGAPVSDFDGEFLPASLRACSSSSSPSSSSPPEIHPLVSDGRQRLLDLAFGGATRCR